MKKREAMQWQLMIEWMDNKLKGISRMLTRNHQSLYRQQIAFKSRTSKKVKEIDSYKRRMQEAEVLNVFYSTALEAEYGLETKSPLQLYDCLIPQIPESSEKRQMTFAQKIVQERFKKAESDYKAECKVRLLEADVRILEEQTKQQIKEMELINWYTQVMEQGIDAKAAMKNYLECKK